MILDAGALTEADLRVPFFLRPAPERGFEVGGRSEALVSLADVAPTLLTLAEAPVPAGMHGASLVPVLAGTQDHVRDHAFARSPLLSGHAAIDGSSLYATLAVDRRTTTVLARSYAGLSAAEVKGEATTTFVETGRPSGTPPNPIEDPAREDAMRARGGGLVPGRS